MFDAAALRSTADHISVRGVEGAGRAKNSVRGPLSEADGVMVCHAPRGLAPPRLEKWCKCVKMRGRGRSRLDDRPIDGRLVQLQCGGTFSPNKTLLFVNICNVKLLVYNVNCPEIKQTTEELMQNQLCIALSLSLPTIVTPATLNCEV